MSAILGVIRPGASLGVWFDLEQKLGKAQGPELGQGSGLGQGVRSAGRAGRFGMCALGCLVGVSGTMGGNVRLPSTQSIDGLCLVSQLCPRTTEQDESSCVT